MPAITFRTIGGVLDMYIFLGPTPDNVVSQYTAVIGRPTMPPYWALGFQLSKYGYNSADELRTVINRNRQLGIPYVIYSFLSFVVAILCHLLTCDAMRCTILVIVILCPSVYLSVCPSVRLSHSCTVSTRFDLRS